MRVALMTEYSMIGGGESNLLSLAKELAKSVEVTLFCHGIVKEKALEESLDVEDFRTEKRWFGSIPLIGYEKVLTEKLNGFDIVHAYSINVLPLLCFVKSKKVWTNHGYWERPFGVRGFVIDKIVDKVVCVSTDVCTGAKFDESKKRKIFLGTGFEIAESERAPFDKKSVDIVCIGRFQHIKGQDLLIDALMELSKSSESKITLHFVGDVNKATPEDMEFKNILLKKAKEALCENLDIRFEGFRSDVRDYIERSDLVVIPSRYESFGMVAIEALACAKPIVAPDIGGIKDIIDSENVGLLFEPRNSRDLSKKIERAIENYDSFSPSVFLERAKEFTIGRQAEKHIKLYESLLDG